MQQNSFTENIYQELLEQKTMLDEQIQILDPMVNQLRKPAATRFLDATILVLLEWFCYAGAIATIIIQFFFTKLYPLYLLPEMAAKVNVTNEMGIGNIDNLILYARGILLLVGVLLIIIARNCNSLRKKNNILSVTGKSMKDLINKTQQKKANLDTLDHRYQAFLNEQRNMIDPN